MNLEKLIRMGQLYEIYSNLLTDKQREIMALYYEEDYSLGEISENLGVSRQSVYDMLKRSEKLLSDYESKLGLYERIEEQNRIFAGLEILIEKIKAESDKGIALEDIDAIEEMARRMLI